VRWLRGQEGWTGIEGTVEDKRQVKILGEVARQGEKARKEGERWLERHIEKLFERMKGLDRQP